MVAKSVSVNESHYILSLVMVLWKTLTHFFEWFQERLGSIRNSQGTKSFDNCLPELIYTHLLNLIEIICHIERPFLLLTPV